MLELEAGQELATMPGCFVFAGGTYEPSALVMIYTDDASLPIGQFQAQFVATGEFV